MRKYESLRNAYDNYKYHRVTEQEQDRLAIAFDTEVGPTVLWTVWIVVGTVLEERDLVAEFGDRYLVYQRNVPILIPRRIVGWISPTENLTRRSTE